MNYNMNMPHKKNFNAPTVLTIFGATGDLMKKKLTPALFHLWNRGWLPDKCAIVGFARKDLGDNGFRSMAVNFSGGMAGIVKKDFESFAELWRYQRGNFSDSNSYAALARNLESIDEAWGMCSNKLFYLAVPPQFYEEIFTHLANSGLTKPCSDETGWTRVLVEKPFGSDLKTAERLDAMLGKLFKEEQVFRIDHYLAKESVQNILALRFSNSIFESSWDGRAIEKVEIKMLEEAGVEERGAFYDRVGTLRDVGQNHMLQMLALIAMERPAVFVASEIRKARAAALYALRPVSRDQLKRDTRRAQYIGYRQEGGVSPDSKTETYFRLAAFIDNPRWEGVPFNLESGKRLNRSVVETFVTFKHVDPCLCPPDRHVQNVLYFQLQPNQEVAVSFWTKRPGVAMELEERPLALNYSGIEKNGELVDAYEKILLDCISGDQTLFASTEEVMASWKFIDSVLDGWKNNEVPLLVYEPESAGPIV